MNELTQRVYVQAIGPITRSTLPESKAEPRREALNDVLYWLWATRTQIRRFSTGLKTEIFEAQQLGVDELRKRQIFSTTSLDEHLLLVAAGQLEKSVKRAGRTYFPSLQLSSNLQIALKHLRNIYEHWEQHRPTFRRRGANKILSGAEFVTHFPSGEPWTVDIYLRRDVVIAKVVSLRSLVRELRTLERTALGLEKSC